MGRSTVICFRSVCSNISRFYISNHGLFIILHIDRRTIPALQKTVVKHLESEFAVTP